MEYSTINNEIEFLKGKINSTREDANKIIIELNEKLKKAELKKKEFDSFTEEQKLAIIIHDNTSWHHPDEDPNDYLWNCYYSSLEEERVHDWTDKEHVKYLEKASELLKVVDYNTALKVIKILQTS